jgi:hypothetical protein
MTLRLALAASTALLITAAPALAQTAAAPPHWSQSPHSHESQSQLWRLNADAHMNRPSV